MELLKTFLKSEQVGKHLEEPLVNENYYYACLKCEGPTITPYRLRCEHVVCQACVTKHDVIACPIVTCKNAFTKRKDVRRPVVVVSQAAGSGTPIVTKVQLLLKDKLRHSFEISMFYDPSSDNNEDAVIFRAALSGPLKKNRSFNDRHNRRKAMHGYYRNEYVYTAVSPPAYQRSSFKQIQASTEIESKVGRTSDVGTQTEKETTGLNLSIESEQDNAPPSKSRNYQTKPLEQHGLVENTKTIDAHALTDGATQHSSISSLL